MTSLKRSLWARPCSRPSISGLKVRVRLGLTGLSPLSRVWAWSPTTTRQSLRLSPPTLGPCAEDQSLLQRGGPRPSRSASETHLNDRTLGQGVRLGARLSARPDARLGVQLGTRVRSSTRSEDKHGFALRFHGGGAPALNARANQDPPTERTRRTPPPHRTHARSNAVIAPLGSACAQSG